MNNMYVDLVSMSVVVNPYFDNMKQNITLNLNILFSYKTCPYIAQFLVFLIVDSVVVYNCVKTAISNLIYTNHPLSN